MPTPTRLAVAWHPDFRDAPDGGVVFRPRGWGRSGWRLASDARIERLVGLHLGIWLLVPLVPVWLAGMLALRAGVLAAPFALAAYLLWLRWLEARLTGLGIERVGPRPPTPQERRRRRIGLGILAGLAVLLLALLALRSAAGR